MILGLGISERPEIDSIFLEREAHDRDSIDLPEVQKELVREILSLKKPTVIFLLNGGMVAVEDFIEHVALIEAFYPGMEGAQALAESIFGKANRWGRMPYTVYKAEWTQRNSMLDHDVTHERTYRYGAEAVVPFGYGLSLTRFRLSFQGQVQRKMMGSCTYTIRVENLGELVGDEVVMAFFHPVKAGRLLQIGI